MEKPRLNGFFLVNRGHFNAAGGYAEGRVLDSLEFLNRG